MIGFEGQKWAIGESVQTIGTGHRTIRDASRIETPFYRTLFASMLARAVPCAPGTSVEVAPVLSLPPGMYYEKERLKEALAGIYDVDAPVQGSLREQGAGLLSCRWSGSASSPKAWARYACWCWTRAGATSRAPRCTSRRSAWSTWARSTGTHAQQPENRPRSTRSVPRALNARNIINHAAKHGILLEDHETDAITRPPRVPNGAHPVASGADSPGARTSPKSSTVRSARSGAAGTPVERIILTGGGAPLIFKYLVDVYPDQIVLAGDDSIEPAHSRQQGRLSLRRCGG
ncbi:MAG: hypothetical protein U0703_27845 [Anaerolineae bacterium]